MNITIDFVLAIDFLSDPKLQ